MLVLRAKNFDLFLNFQQYSFQNFRVLANSAGSQRFEETARCKKSQVA